MRSRSANHRWLGSMGPETGCLNGKAMCRSTTSESEHCRTSRCTQRLIVTRECHHSTRKMKISFKFIRTRRYVDADLQLMLRKTTPADPVRAHVPGYEFDMRETGSTTKIGSIRLRIGRTRPLIGWCGHIGYGVDAKARGRHYAARSCRLLFPLAYAHGLRTIWITCAPKNVASRRTCEIAGGRYVNTVRVPKGTEMYEKGMRWVRRYRFDLGRILSHAATHGTTLPRRIVGVRRGVHTQRRVTRRTVACREGYGL
jgi:tagatose 1,6-diphosphate aldolase